MNKDKANEVIEKLFKSLKNRYQNNLESQKKEIKKVPQRITKTTSFIKIYINFPSEKDDWKKFEKYNVTIALKVFYAKKEKKYILLMFQNINQIGKNNLFFL